MEGEDRGSVISNYRWPYSCSHLSTYSAHTEEKCNNHSIVHSSSPACFYVHSPRSLPP